MLFDKIYIINLEKNIIKKEKSIAQLRNNNILNFEIVDAINTVNNEVYNALYQDTIKNMSSHFVKYNFNKGALGCLFSHIKCIKDAKQNNYKQILILEDDFNAIINLKKEITDLFDNIDDKWDFIYLGKKQGTKSDSFEIVKNIHNNKDYFDIVEINEYIYRPNYKTWGTHAILIKNTIFDDIIDFENKIVGPIDLMLMKLYPRYNFLCVKKDLFVTIDEISDIQCVKKNVYWDWNASLYTIIKTQIIKNIFIMGLKNSDHTHHYIHKMYYNFFKYYYPNINVYWYDDKEINDMTIFGDDSIIFYSPCHVKYKKIPDKGFHIVHLDEYKNRGYKSIQEFLHDDKNSKIINSKNYIILTARENISNLKYFGKTICNKTICLPWFSDIFYSEIIPVKQNLKKHFIQNRGKEYLCYMGSIWNINIKMIIELVNICEKNKVKLLLKGRVFSITKDEIEFIKNITDDNYSYIKYEPFDYDNCTTNIANTLTFIDKKYGIKGLLPLQGFFQHADYISNRIFETISNGYLIVTNNLLTTKYFNSAIYDCALETLILKYVNILNDEELYINLLDKQIDEFFAKFYGYKNITSLIDFMRETCLTHNLLLLYKNENASNFYDIFFTNDESITCSEYIMNNEDIRNAIRNNNNYIVIIKENSNFDIYLVEELIAIKNYRIHLDVDLISTNLINKEFIINICNKLNKKYIDIK